MPGDGDVEDATQPRVWHVSRSKKAQPSLCCRCVVLVVFVLAVLAVCVLAVVLKAHLAPPTGAGTRAHVAAHHGTEHAHRHQQVRVLCWVMTRPENHQLKTQHAKATWGKHCNTLLIMSSAEDELLGTIKLEQDRGHLWDMTKAAFSYVHAHHRQDADWFLQADDETYVIVENLRYVLSWQDPWEPIYYSSSSSRLTQSHMQGPGFVLSRQALDTLIGEGLANGRCRTGDLEDLEIGSCMDVLGVTAGDSRDEYGRSRFLQYGPEFHLSPAGAAVLPVNSGVTYNEHPDQPGINGISDTAISFHNVTPSMMYVLDFLLYHLRPNGIASPDLVHGGGGGGTTQPGIASPGLVHGGGGGGTTQPGIASPGLVHGGGGGTNSTTRAEWHSTNHGK